MKKRMVIALLAASFAAGKSFAADWPVTALPQRYRPGLLIPVEWTGLYFGVNAGYGWATGSSAGRPVRAAGFRSRKRLRHRSASLTPTAPSSPAAAGCAAQS